MICEVDPSRVLDGVFRPVLEKEGISGIAISMTKAGMVELGGLSPEERRRLLEKGKLAVFKIDVSVLETPSLQQKPTSVAPAVRTRSPTLPLSPTVELTISGAVLLELLKPLYPGLLRVNYRTGGLFHARFELDTQAQDALGAGSREVHDIRVTPKPTIWATTIALELNYVQVLKAKILPQLGPDNVKRIAYSFAKDELIWKLEMASKEAAEALATRGNIVVLGVPCKLRLLSALSMDAKLPQVNEAGGSGVKGQCLP